MSSREDEDIELLRAIWICFESPGLVIRSHPILSEAVPTECVGPDNPPDLNKVIDCIASNGKAKWALDKTLNALRRDWFKLASETKAKVLQLSETYPRRIHGFSSLGPKDAALMSIQWEASDALYHDVRKEAFLKLAKDGLNFLGSGGSGSFNPGGKQSKSTVILGLIDVLPPLMIARIEFDLAAIVHSRTSLRKECEGRVRGRAIQERQEWYAKIHDVYSSIVDKQTVPDLSYILDELNAVLNPLIESISDMHPSVQRQAEFEQLTSTMPEREKPVVKKGTTLLQNWIDYFQGRPIFAALIILALIVGYLLPNLKLLKELGWWPSRIFQAHDTSRLVVRSPSVIVVKQGQIKNVDLTGEGFQGVDGSSLTADTDAGIKITNVRRSITADGEQLTFSLDASNAAIGSHYLILRNTGHESTVPLIVTEK